MENKQTINDKLVLFILAVLGIIIYHRVLSFPLLSWGDSLFITNDPSIKGLTFHNIRYIFTHYYNNGFYGPFHLFTYMLIYSITGIKPLWLHALNALIFIADAMLVYLFVKRIETVFTPLEKASEPDSPAVPTVQEQGSLTGFTAAIAAILFLLAPVNVDSAAWVSALGSTQSVFFALVALIEYNSFIKKGSRLSYAVSLLAFLCAILTKQSAATVVLIILIMEWYIYRKHFLSIFFIQLPFYIISAISVSIFLIGQILMNKNGLTGGNISSHILSLIPNISGILGYPNRIVLPFKLVSLYPQSVIYNLFSPRLVISIILLAAFLYLMIHLYRKHHSGFFWMSWYFANMIPGFGILPVYNFTNINLILPSIGIYVLIGMGLEYLYTTQSTRKPGIAVAGIILLVFGILAYQRVGVWKDDEHLWRNVTEKLPDYYFGHKMYAWALVADNKIPEALKQAETGLKLNPYDTDILAGFSLYYLQNKEYGKALLYIKKAIKYAPDNVNYRHLLAVYYQKTKDYTDYEKELRTCVLTDPYNLDFIDELTDFYANNGKTEKAISLLKEIIASHQDNAVFYRLLGEFYLKYTNNTYAARKAIEMSLYLDPYQEDAAILKQIISKLPR